MLHPVYRLAIDAPQQRVRLGPVAGRAWRTRVVVPRALCVFESLPTTGVAWHERAAFARLQVLRLVPYARTQACAVVKAGRLMLWLWDADEVAAALRAEGLAPQRVRVLPETLLLPLPAADGVVAQRCDGGTDRLQLAGGAILASTWQPEARGAGRAAPDLLPRPWGRDLLAGDGLASPAARLQQAAALGAWGLAFASAAALAYWGGQWQGLSQRLSQAEAGSGDDGVELERLMRLRQAGAADRAWIDRAQALAAGADLEPLLGRLQPVLEAQGLSMREFELRNDDLRITLASGGPGVEIDLPRALAALSALPGLEAVQLRQSSEPQLAAFVMKVPGFRRAAFDRAEDRR
ncbi:hypothetical protein [Piscinibacter sakaiensis]|uniref:Uncharacterized protein n=1 Tax=Piscinibacter sakaiensis TaxID=1547922 RepID=A0A0K8NUB9_PISS1|nr:hypothetical protein [Piscinibacter sakaiensis]GAP33864.1 hypothetical protein ISF6_1119 [Piscinibacter sakaiensis]